MLQLSFTDYSPASKSRSRDGKSIPTKVVLEQQLGRRISTEPGLCDHAEGTQGIGGATVVAVPDNDPLF